MCVCVCVCTCELRMQPGNVELLSCFHCYSGSISDHAVTNLLRPPGKQSRLVYPDSE